MVALRAEMQQLRAQNEAGGSSPTLVLENWLHPNCRHFCCDAAAAEAAKVGQQYADMKQRFEAAQAKLDSISALVVLCLTRDHLFFQH